MDSTSFCHQRSPSSDRFLGFFSFSPPSSAAAGEELNEAEVFWTTDFTEPSDAQNPRLSLTRRVNSGILAVLPEPGLPAPVMYRKPALSSSSSSKPIPSIPRFSQSQSQSQSQSVPTSRKFQSSAPMKVPMLSRAVEKHRRNDDLADVVDDDDDGDDEMLPPHELVARGSGLSARTTFRCWKAWGGRSKVGTCVRSGMPFGARLGFLIEISSFVFLLVDQEFWWLLLLMRQEIGGSFCLVPPLLFLIC